MAPTWALDAAAALFMLHGGLHVAVGLLAAALHERAPAKVRMLVMSPRADAALLGAPVPELVAAAPALAEVRNLWLRWASGLMVSVGLLVCIVAWFGLRAGLPWAFAALAAGALAMVPFGAWMTMPYRRAGARPGLADVPPVITVPSALLGPALALGAWGLWG